MSFHVYYTIGMFIAMIAGLIIGTTEERARIEDDCVYTTQFRVQSRVYQCFEHYTKTIIPEKPVKKK